MRASAFATLTGPVQHDNPGVTESLSNAWFGPARKQTIQGVSLLLTEAEWHTAAGLACILRLTTDALCRRVTSGLPLGSTLPEAAA